MEKLSVKEAMERLQVSETTIRRMIKRGDLPNAVKEDRRFWIPQSDIDAYLQKQQETAPPSETESDLTTIATKASQTAQLHVESPEPPQYPEPAPQSAAQPELISEVSVSEAEEIPQAAPKPASSTIAQPIDELDDASVVEKETDSTPPSSEPAPSRGGAVRSSAEYEQSLKWTLVQAGILSTTWLEEIFHSLRVALEKYKQKTFPEAKDE